MIIVGIADNRNAAPCCGDPKGDGASARASALFGEDASPEPVGTAIGYLSPASTLRFFSFDLVCDATDEFRKNVFMGTYDIFY